MCFSDQITQKKRINKTRCPGFSPKTFSRLGLGSSLFLIQQASGRSEITVTSRSKPLSSRASTQLFRFGRFLPSSGEIHGVCWVDVFKIWLPEFICFYISNWLDMPCLTVLIDFSTMLDERWSNRTQEGQAPQIYWVFKSIPGIFHSVWCNCHLRLDMCAPLFESWLSLMSNF